ncbi:hypothetical protein [Streptomyces sp. CB03911]|uniref:hypothetical protein n=1 Tax=Streptomyces sp. CB03911 TaxID=1804758 RepID=UPI00093DD8EC|nr:hypothetical protein [Streptomyces sp. CB03911]OKI25682.1 hypothetical protein A6A07_30985 [Streptomyces sp. CB03911]
MLSSGAQKSPTPTIYLRCHPFDVWGMTGHRDVVQRYARSLGFAEAAVFLDNGCRSTGAKPRFEQLLAGVVAGFYRVVFVPGWWVFSSYDAQARAVVGRLEELGCRVVELPSPRLAAWDWAAGPTCPRRQGAVAGASVPWW